VKYIVINDELTKDTWDNLEHCIPLTRTKNTSLLLCNLLVLNNLVWDGKMGFTLSYHSFSGVSVEIWDINNERYTHHNRERNKKERSFMNVPK
jgi:hypothetical protein